MRGHDIESIRKDLLRRFYLPPTFWSERFDNLNGGYGSSVTAGEDGVANGIGEHVLVARRLVDDGVCCALC